MGCACEMKPAAPMGKFARAITCLERVALGDEANARVAEQCGDKQSARKLAAEALLLREAAGLLKSAGT